MLRRLVEIFLSIPAPLAVAAVFFATAGETAFFLGLVLPGELAVIGRRRKRWAKARAWLARWEAFAVFLGRFTAFLRSIIPAAAGAARLPYGRFLPWNVAAGALWGVGSVLLGYFAGRNYETLAHRAGLLSLALFVLLLAAALVSLFRRRKRARSSRARRSRRIHASRSRA
jgi:membrane-associated protein